MRRLLLVVALVALAGCAGIAPTADAPAEMPASGDSTDSSGPEPTPVENGTANDAPIEHELSPDPEEDTLGWHDGYWHDDPVSVNATDGLNETELDVVTARAMARIEVLRNRSFEETVAVSLINRTEFGNRQAGTPSGGDSGFEEARYRATFLVGGDESATERQRETTQQSVAGYYSPGTGEIVIVSDSKTPRISIDTLVHELTHALQDQHFDLSEVTAVSTQDRTHGRLGLVEGDAETVRAEYEERCGEVWRCVTVAGGENSEENSETADGAGSDIHLGLYITSWFPYDDGPGFIEHLRDGSGWDGVDEAYEHPPNSSREILDPAIYGTFEPTAVELDDRSTDEWTRLESGGTDHQRIGQAGLTAMFAYTLYDDSSAGGVIDPRAFLDTDSESQRTDLLNYDLPATSGLVGDRLHLYERTDEYAHVWRLEWNSAANATEFADTYERLLSYWGGQADGAVWTIGEDSPFTGVYDLRVDGSTVTITNAPTEEAIENVHP
ncbi:Hvo_1808 family surface protein [Halovenus marina]|uniref:Hvo_1808 family surface protein n=1 Tax=Halovenus marina TaxID=3396621 RepID=UPI003F566D74